jgi:DNA-binding CsgD family transcriptional regulator
MTLLDEAMSRLGEEYVAQGKTSTFETLKLLDPVNSNAALSYEQVANALEVSVGSVKTLIHRLRRQYASLLREEVARSATRERSMKKSILSAKH